MGASSLYLPGKKRNETPIVLRPNPTDPFTIFRLFAFTHSTCSCEHESSVRDASCAHEILRAYVVDYLIMIYGRALK